MRHRAPDGTALTLPSLLTMLLTILLTSLPISLLACLALALALLAGCQQYDLTVNDRVVYTPRPLFSDFAAADPALQRCLEEAVKYDRVSSASQLRELACPDAGIADLAGLATFTGLRELDLSGNALTDIGELSGVIALEEAYLDDNDIVDPMPLASLQALDTVDLSGNVHLDCPSRQSLLRVTNLTLPSHCG